MGWLDRFRKQKGSEPQRRYEDELLGTMFWSEDEEAWAGESEGIMFLVAYDLQSTPTEDLLVYARQMLADPAQFREIVERAKPAAIAVNPRLANEVEGLRVVAVLFYRYKTVRRIFAGLEGGKRDRSWRVEFSEEHCEGIGFDT